MKYWCGCGENEGNLHRLPLSSSRKSIHLTSERKRSSLLIGSGPTEADFRSFSLVRYLLKTDQPYDKKSERGQKVLELKTRARNIIFLFFSKWKKTLKSISKFFKISFSNVLTSWLHRHISPVFWGPNKNLVQFENKPSKVSVGAAVLQTHR